MFVSRKILDSIYGTADMASPRLRPGPGVRALNTCQARAMIACRTSRHERLPTFDTDVSKQRRSAGVFLRTASRMACIPGPSSAEWQTPHNTRHRFMSRYQFGLQSCRAPPLVRHRIFQLTVNDMMRFDRPECSTTPHVGANERKPYRCLTDDKSICLRLTDLYELL